MNQPQGTSKSQYVSNLFGNIAQRYDLLNNLMSFGQHQAWRRQAVKMVHQNISVSGLVLDIATGTCDFAIDIVSFKPKTSVIGIDFSLPMLKVGIKKVTRKNLKKKIDLMIADGHELPFEDNTFTVVTVGFGIRNFDDPKSALTEMNRVLKPGGRLAILDIFPIQNRKFTSRLFNLAFKRVSPILGFLFANNRQAYEYLPASAISFMSSVKLIDLTKECGFLPISNNEVAFGSVSILISEKVN
ncbi:MAG: demethylmenaquinone methyltransferase / 2-methoxy-6-polyprenyl-1,4-benzoquinol methylase [Chloroflexi bacterium]|nr:MAG: demethylmenaquinone methyltransferase / 2-methoxy-6-polyprenyl-1,4-benzoquinol methylase [Chloroflexota bacterium]